MLLNAATPSGEMLYECDECHLTGERVTFVFREDGRHLCFSCWYERDRSRKKEVCALVVEF